MDLHDLVSAAKTGWRWIVIGLIAGGALAAAYLVVTEPQYEASAEVVVLANDPASIAEAEQGASMSTMLASTVATIIDSPTVLDAIAPESLTTAEVVSMTRASVRDSSSAITITVSSADPDLAATIANDAAESARRTVPGMLGADGVTGALPVTVEIISTAGVPSTPVSPFAQGVLVIGVALGLCGGLALAIATGRGHQSATPARRRPSRLTH